MTRIMLTSEDQGYNHSVRRRKRMSYCRYDFLYALNTPTDCVFCQDGRWSFSSWPSRKLEYLDVLFHWLCLQGEIWIFNISLQVSYNLLFSELILFCAWTTCRICIKKETEPYVTMTKILEDFTEALKDQRKLRRCLAQGMAGFKVIFTCHFFRCHPWFFQGWL